MSPNTCFVCAQSIQTYKKEKIAVIGMGYIGLPLAVEFGKHRPILGFDVNISRIAELKVGLDPFQQTHDKVKIEEERKS